MGYEGGRLEDTYDVIIVGMGVAGLITALELPQHLKVLMIAKTTKLESNSYLAQGGMSVLRDGGDYMRYFEDTMRAGHYKNDPKAVHCMVSESRKILRYLCEIGVPFEREEGELKYTREGAHSVARIVHYEDVTGKVIVETLIEEVEQRGNITISEQTTMIDWIVEVGRIVGVAIEKEGYRDSVYSDTVVLATGGIGGKYKHSTNYPMMTGDSLELAKAYGVKLKDMDYVQIHPTTFFSTEIGRSFLITEAVRGEGGILLSHKGERFVDEILPRDIVTQAIYRKMEEEQVEYVYLSFERIDKEYIKKRFPNIYRYCLEMGYDIMKVPIPVVPAQHYFMGGIEVDLDGRTSMDGLYAVGETSCTGVHGKNRLASNSLLEAMVFAKRVAQSILKSKKEVGKHEEHWYEKHMG